jgi:hypothetical protein
VTDNRWGIVLGFSSLLHPVKARLAKVLHLSGPLSGDPSARTLHALLLSILVWFGTYCLIFSPFSFFAPKKLSGVIALALIAGISLSALRRGSLRKSALIYVWGMWLSFSVLIVCSGGIRSPGLVFYAALPISAAWLLGYRGTLWTAAGCLASGFVLALLETLGLGPYWYFPGEPFGILKVLILITLMTTVPVARVMKTLQEAWPNPRLLRKLCAASAI